MKQSKKGYQLDRIGETEMWVVVFIDHVANTREEVSLKLEYAEANALADRLSAGLETPGPCSRS